MTTNKGFTIVELVIVLGIFGILMVAGTDFLIQTIRNSNRSAIQNEVRQNASRVMQDIVTKMRDASLYSYTANTLTITNPNGTFTYNVDTNTGVLKLGTATIISDAVAVCGGACGSCGTSGLSLSGTYPGPATISLTVQQAPRYAHTDFCAKVTLLETVTPRRY